MALEGWHMPTDQVRKVAPPESISVLSRLDRAFAKRLWRAKNGSATAAFTYTRKIRSGAKKAEIIKRQFQKWIEESVDAIRFWFRQYLKLAQAFPHVAGGGPLNWTVDLIWEQLGGVAGILQHVDLAGSVGQEKIDSAWNEHLPLNRKVLWWFAVATEGNFEPKDWTAPPWLQQNLNTRELLFQSSNQLAHRFNEVIEEELAKVQVEKAASHSYKHGGNEEARAAGPTLSNARGRPRPPLRSYRSELKRAIVTALTKQPNATDLEICELIDSDGTAEVKGPDRTLKSAYLNPKRKASIQTTISKVRRDMRGLL
jgi:hypothetical protein